MASALRLSPEVKFEILVQVFPLLVVRYTFLKPAYNIAGVDGF